MMTKQDDIFTIPVASLSKKQERSEMKRAVREHGDTDPLKLEERRTVVSERMLLVGKHIEMLQLHKKAMIAEHDAKIRELAVGFNQEKGADNSPIEAQISAVEQSKAAQIMQFESAIVELVSNQNITEALCLVVDGVTLREVVESKTGKKGLMRFSIAGFMSDVDEATVRTYKRMRKVYDLQRVMALATIPKTIDDLLELRKKTAERSMERANIDAQIVELNKLSGQIVANASDEDVDGEDFEYQESDIVGADDLEKLKKSVQGVD